MNYTIRIFFICFLSVLTYGMQAQNSHCSWPDKTMVIDGRANEWPDFFRFYMSGARLQYDLYNDNSNLYICVKATDVEAQTRIMKSGFSFWIDTTGKKKQKTGISFPLKMEHQQDDMQQRRIKASDDPSAGPSEKSRANRLKEKVIFAQSMIKATGMAGVTDPMIGLQNKYGIEVAFDWDSLSTLCIEYKIPLALIYHREVTASGIQHPIGLSVAVGAAESGGGEHHDSGSGGGNRGSGGMGGGGARSSMGGGNAGGGHRSGSGQSMQSINPNDSEQKGWIRLDLAKGPEKR
jgi:uncharacterized membrane protein YgcG